jgi:lysophospholipase L1-like esterase
MLAVFLSMLLAGIWQLLDPVPYTPLQPMGSVRYADGGSVPPSQQKQVTPQVSVSAEPQPAEPVQEESVEAEPGKESLSTVAEGSWAPSSYFDDAVFFGDSLTDGIKLYDVMNNATVISHTGINLTNIFTREVISQSSGGKVTMLDALQKQNPKKVYILLGANSMGMEKGMFLSAYRRLVKEVVARTNGATIYVQSILPVTHTYETNRPEFANSVIDEYNAGLRQMAIEEGVEYLDVAEAFKNENNALPEEMSTDGMHFGTAGYQKWFAYLRVHTA